MRPNDLWYAALAYPTVQLYGNSVLSSLNARALLHGTGNTAFSHSYMLSSRVAHSGSFGMSAPCSADCSVPVASVSCSASARKTTPDYGSARS
jgi:hypothetical protein